MKIEIVVSLNDGYGSESKKTIDIDDEELKGMNAKYKEQYINEIVDDEAVGMISWDWNEK